MGDDVGETNPAYERLMAAQLDTSFETRQHRDALIAGQERESRRRKQRLKLPKVY